MPSLLEALERKYFSTYGSEELNKNVPLNDDDDARLISIFIPRLSPLMSVPELLVLNDCDIDHAGDFETIKDKCQRVRELDLAQNKLRDWSEVFRILRHMPRIEFLNLSKNHLCSPITHQLCHTPAINNLRSIVLNGTYLDWVCVDVLLENLPILEELHLSLNNYTEVLIDVDVESEQYANKENSNVVPAAVTTGKGSAKCCRQTAPHRALKTLHFTGNPIENWHEICRLGRVFPNLQNLVLADCPIKSIDIDNGAGDGDRSHNDSYKHFPNLVFLNISYANIGTWEDIDRLAAFPKLRNLRVKSLPLWDRLECTEHERRQLLIARLPNVSLVNGGGGISADERETAERAFIRHYMDKPESERPKRYNELVAIHGKLDPLVNVSLKPDKRIKVFLTFRDRTQTRLVDINRTVADLKLKLGTFVGRPANKLRLFYVDQDYKDHGPEEMKYPSKLLYSYNIQNGDEIIIDEKK